MTDVENVRAVVCQPHGSAADSVVDGIQDGWDCRVYGDEVHRLAEVEKLDFDDVDTDEMRGYETHEIYFQPESPVECEYQGTQVSEFKGQSVRKLTCSN